MPSPLASGSGGGAALSAGYAPAFGALGRGLSPFGGNPLRRRPLTLPPPPGASNLAGGGDQGQAANIIDRQNVIDRGRIIPEDWRLNLPDFPQAGNIGDKGGTGNENDWPIINDITVPNEPVPINRPRRRDFAPDTATTPPSIGRSGMTPNPPPAGSTTSPTATRTPAPAVNLPPSNPPPRRPTVGGPTVPPPTQATVPAGTTPPRNLNSPQPTTGANQAPATRLARNPAPTLPGAPQSPRQPPGTPAQGPPNAIRRSVAPVSPAYQTPGPTPNNYGQTPAGAPGQLIAAGPRPLPTQPAPGRPAVNYTPPEYSNPYANGNYRVFGSFPGGPGGPSGSFGGGGGGNSGGFNGGFTGYPGSWEAQQNAINLESRYKLKQGMANMARNPRSFTDPNNVSGTRPSQVTNTAPQGQLGMTFAQRNPGVAPSAPSGRSFRETFKLPPPPGLAQARTPAQAPAPATPQLANLPSVNPATNAGLPPGYSINRYTGRMVRPKSPPRFGQPVYQGAM